MPNQIILSGYDEIQELLTNLQKKTDDTAPMMAEIANQLYNITMDSFKHQSDPAGLPWKRLENSTLKKKKGKGKILYDKGELHTRIYSKSDNDSAEIGVNLPYAAIHQFGGNAGRGKDVVIPARPYMPIKADGELYDVAIRKISLLLEDLVDEL